MRCGNPVLDIYTTTCHFPIYIVSSGEKRKYIHSLWYVSRCYCYRRMLHNNKKRSRNIRKCDNETDDHMENTPDDGGLHSGNVHHEAWNDVGIRFLSPQSPILYDQWNCMDWGCCSDAYFPGDELFDI